MDKASVVSPGTYAMWECVFSVSHFSPSRYVVLKLPRTFPPHSRHCLSLHSFFNLKDIFFIHIKTWVGFSSTTWDTLAPLDQCVEKPIKDDENVIFIFRLLLFSRGFIRLNSIPLIIDVFLGKDCSLIYKIINLIWFCSHQTVFYTFF